VRPPDAPDLPEDELDRIQDAHLANQARLGDEGYLIAAGPFRATTTSAFAVSPCSRAIR